MTDAPATAHFPEDNDDVVTLHSAGGEKIDFISIAEIVHGGVLYAILQPVELLEGMSDEEALVFRVARGEDGKDEYKIESDSAIIDAVFLAYNKLLDKEEAEDEV